MWIEDIRKALFFLDGSKCCIWKIENGAVYFTDFMAYPIEALIENYEAIKRGEKPIVFPNLYRE